jgi:diguanylate cyclase (GGDEF)-like protein
MSRPDTITSYLKYLRLSGVKGVMNMNIVLGIGIIMVIGFLGGRIASLLKLPSLTGYIISGLIFGPYVGKVLPEELIHQLKSPVSLVAISIIAFMLGGDLSFKTIKQMGPQMVKIACIDSLCTFSLVIVGLYYLAGQKMSVALPLAALAVSPAPTVIVPIVKELKARGHFTNVLLMVSALEDISCVIFISIAIAVSQTLIAGGSPSFRALLTALIEILGSVGFGLLLGIITTLALKKIRPGEFHVLFTLAMILAGAGITTVFSLSALIAILTMGVIVYNCSKNTRELFTGIEKMANPILLLFFTLAGGTLKPALIPVAGIAVLVYVAARLISKSTGAYCAAKMAGMDQKVYRNLPICLFSQAGTTLGLTMIVAQQLPTVSSNILTVMLSAVIFFEVIAPPLTRNILIKLGEANLQEADAGALQVSSDPKKIAFINEATQLYNGRYFHIRLDEEIKRAKRYTQFFSLMLFRVDSFIPEIQAKGIENTAERLRHFGKSIKDNLRSTDILTHLEPGVFALILPETNIEGANFLSERLKEKILSACLDSDSEKPHSEKPHSEKPHSEKPHSEKPHLENALSIDIASYPTDIEMMEKLITHGQHSFQTS